MATTVPALRGKFGNTEYWLTTMSIGEFIQKVRFPQDLEGWEDGDEENLEERYQRKINVQRIRKSIAPYFATDPNRFSGSLVLAVMNSEDMQFESLDEMGGGRSSLPQLYKSAAREMGFLTFQGQEVLVPLDGQHRAKAFKFAIDGADDNNRPIASMRANQELARDQVTAILIRWNPQKARLIFNKINRYAKPTVKGDNLITDDDDAVAVMTREFIGKGSIINSRLVRIGANTLNSAAIEFTTLATFYDATLEIVNGLGIAGSGSPRTMTKERREAVTHNVKAIWERVLTGIDLFVKALEDATPAGDDTRKRIREDTLLGKPIGQLALVRAFMLMRERCEGIADEELCARLNLINWSVTNRMWEGVLMNPNGRVMSGKGTVNRAREFIAHLGGVTLNLKEVDVLREHIHGADWQDHKLPPPVA